MAAGDPSPHLDTDKDNTFRILVATDVHLGYKHLDPILGNNSINTFQEVLQLAHDLKVDFVLLGGDLFHDNKPPRDILYSCFQLLKRYCEGDRKPAFEIEDADAARPKVSSTNWTISMPVFSIHGNHDEPTGPNNLSVMDLLHSSGLVYYFGKTNSIEEITVKPVLLKKGSTRIALFGVGSIRSDKLQKMYRNKSVFLERPTQDPEDWFNIFVLHQNHVRRPDNTHVEEASIHGFLDLVIWGHEHESQLRPRNVKGDGDYYWLSQPGSTIATQFKQSETKQKNVGLLTVRGREFRLEPVALQTVRQMYILDHVPRGLAEDVSDQEQVKRLMEDCQQKVERVLKKAERTRGTHQPPEPRIRIKVQQQQDLSGFSTFRFGLQYKGKVANPDSILAFGRKMTDDDDDGVAGGLLFPTRGHSAIFSVHDLLRQQLREQPMSFQILQEADLLQIVKDSLDSKDKNVVCKVVGERLGDVQNRLKDIALWPSSQPQVSRRDPATGQVTGDTERPDSDRDLFEDIDRFCRQFADSDNRPNAPERSAASDGSSISSENPLEDTHGGAVGFNESEDEPWLEEVEDQFFNAPSRSTQSSNIPSFSRTISEQQHNEAAPSLRRTSTVPGSSDLTDLGPSTSGLSSFAYQETALWLRVDRSASRDDLESGVNSSQRRSSTQPSTGPVPSPCKQPRLF